MDLNDNQIKIAMYRTSMYVHQKVSANLYNKQIDLSQIIICLWPDIVKQKFKKDSTKDCNSFK